MLPLIVLPLKTPVKSVKKRLFRWLFSRLFGHSGPVNLSSGIPQECIGWGIPLRNRSSRASKGGEHPRVVLGRPNTSSPRYEKYRFWASMSSLSWTLHSRTKLNIISAQRGSFWDGHPADIRGSFARISRPKTSVRVLKILEKQAFGRGYPWPEGADVHDPKGFPKTSVRKTLGWIFVPYSFVVNFPKNLLSVEPKVRLQGYGYRGTLLS